MNQLDRDLSAIRSLPSVYHDYKYSGYRDEHPISVTPSSEYIMAKSSKDKSTKTKKPRAPMSENGFKRIGHKAGVKRMNRDTHDMNRKELIRILEIVIGESLITAKNSKRKTINSKDVLSAIERQGTTVYGA